MSTNQISTTGQAAPARGFSLSPQSLDEAMAFAAMMSKSSIVPKDYQGSPGNILVAIQWGAEIGLAPLQAMQSIAVINGRPSIWGDAMLALVRGSGLLEFIREEPTDAGCTCTLKRRGEPEVSRSFSVEDAKKAQLWGKAGPWQTAPKRMMQMRARAFALRDVFTDVLRGVHVAEEAQDLPAERHMGAVDEIKPEAPALPAGRGDRARDALAKRKPAALPAPALDDVLAAINQAATTEALRTAAALAANLGDREKELAREAYGSRKEALKQPVAEAGAGVATEAASAHADFDPAQMVEKIAACTDPRTLQLMGEEVDELPAGAGLDAAVAALLKRDAELADGVTG